MTYGVWAPPLPIPLRVQFSDKQKHIQALASHFTLCALAGGNAFLEPLAYSPKNGSSWLSFFFFFKRERGGERRHMWRIRPHLSSSTLSARPLLPEPSLLPVSWWTSPRGHTHARKLFFLYLQHTTQTHLTVSLHLCPTLTPSLCAQGLQTLNIQSLCLCALSLPELQLDLNF